MSQESPDADNYLLTVCIFINRLSIMLVCSNNLWPSMFQTVALVPSRCQATLWIINGPNVVEPLWNDRIEYVA